MADDDLLILVTPEDEIMGFRDKESCHNVDGILHRAFSIFLFNDAGALLLQQRAEGKRLWPGFWSNTCCSHPRKGETVEEAAVRRLDEELGMSASLELLYSFIYQARFGDKGSEHELCSVLIGRSKGEPHAEPDEIAAVRWVDPADLDREIDAHAERFTPWFKMEWNRLRQDYQTKIDALRVTDSS